MKCGEYKICKSKTYENNRTNLGRGKREVYFYKVCMLTVKWCNII